MNGPNAEMLALLDEVCGELDRWRSKYTELPAAQWPKTTSRRAKLQALRKEMERMRLALDEVGRVGEEAGGRTGRSTSSRREKRTKAVGGAAATTLGTSASRSSTAWAEHVTSPTATGDGGGNQSAFRRRYDNAFSTTTPTGGRVAGSAMATAPSHDHGATLNSSSKGGLPSSAPSSSNANQSRQMPPISFTAGAAAGTGKMTKLEDVLSISRQTQQLQAEMASQRDEIHRMKHEITPHFRDLVARDENYLRRLTASQKELHSKLEVLMAERTVGGFGSGGGRVGDSAELLRGEGGSLGYQPPQRRADHYTLPGPLGMSRPVWM
eukprot:CAMPEP_0178995152 /NCGR_PEP_ID=MMETSP0795-20121207/7682_1 /TAXON_ID=88552 /ORGANISM="Amoebophrya sp., Strain Ameob2" /LENGTH=323 /DNA_ID=CAMNT_0020687455 /DNA_START=1 /DNA_END=972 /DNA_ORIENTATION=-